MLNGAAHLSRNPAIRRVLTSVLVLSAVFASAGPLLAQGGPGFDPTKTPVTMVPAPADGALAPASILGDGSGWNFSAPPGPGNRYWHDVDIENGWLFTTTGRGLQVFDARTTPQVPEAKAYFFASRATVPDWHQSDVKFYLFGLDAPAGNDNVVAVAGISENGLLIFDTSNKSLTPRLTYQDGSKSGTQVWATTYNNTSYAFYAATSSKVLVYNLSAALHIVNPNNSKGCLDVSPSSIPCQDGQGRKVYVGKVNTQTGATYLHGVGSYLAVSGGGVEIWKVDNPSSPQRVAKFLPPGQSHGVAMWQEGASYYLAVVQATGTAPRILRIYDVSCVTSGCGTASPPLVGTYFMNHTVAAEMLYVTFSRAAGTPFLYIGGDNVFSGGTQREYLVDVSNPANPVEVTPELPGGYWGWYYFGNPTGFNWVMPRTAKLATIGGTTHLYRAAFGLLDVHRFNGTGPIDPVPAVGNVRMAPTNPKVCQRVTFTGESITGQPPLNYSWQILDSGNNPLPGVSDSDPTLDWVTDTVPPGAYTARLTVTNGSGQGAGSVSFNLAGPGPLPAGGFAIQVSGSGATRTFSLPAEHSAAEWRWDFGDGTPVVWSSNPADANPAHTFPAAGTYQVKVSLRNNCSQPGVVRTSAVLPVVVSGNTNQPLQARFTYSPVPVLPNQAVTFNGSSSTGNPTLYLWDFGDGTPAATGTQVTHTFTRQGDFTVELSVSAPSSACPPQPFCESQTRQTVHVTGSALAASFNSDICHAELSFVVCNTDVNVEVTFVDASTGNITSRIWSFGDGETATGTVVKHTYRRAGTWPLTLTVSDGTSSASFTRNIIVAGPLTEAMVLPWIAKTVEGPMLQTSDLYLHNPGRESIDVTLEFRRRGTPETVPPKATRTIGPNATLFVSDLVKSLFNRENISGFLAVTVDRGGVQPVVVSFNTTSRNDGSGEELGQTVPGFLLSNTGAASTAGNLQVQHLVGLNDNDERIAYFGLSNPGSNPVTYRLRFFDNLGHEIGTGSQPVTLSRYGFKQYQPKDIRALFGLADKDDYRVLVESTQGAPIFPFGANLRLGSLDPSFLTVGSGAERVYLLGMLSTRGPNNSTWRSDVVLANTGSQVVIVDLTYTNVGLTSAPTDTIRETLQPGESRRLADVIGTKWNVRNGVGVLTVESDAPGGLFPLVQGESYDNTNPAKRYGQTLPAVTAEQAAGVGRAQYLVGLREDAKSRTTFWVHNPGPDAGSYEIVFRGLDGQELGRISNVNIPAGRLRQLNKAQFPAGLTGTFTVQVIVRSGKVLTAAQVVNNKTNDPAYVQGETR